MKEKYYLAIIRLIIVAQNAGYKVKFIEEFGFKSLILKRKNDSIDKILLIPLNKVKIFLKFYEKARKEISKNIKKKKDILN